MARAALALLLLSCVSRPGLYQVVENERAIEIAQEIPDAQKRERVISALKKSSEEIERLTKRTEKLQAEKENKASFAAAAAGLGLAIGVVATVYFLARKKNNRQ